MTALLVCDQRELKNQLSAHTLCPPDLWGDAWVSEYIALRRFLHNSGYSAPEVRARDYTQLLSNEVLYGARYHRRHSLDHGMCATSMTKI